MEKLGSYITNLMLTVRDSEEKHFIRELALNELIKLKDDVSSFIFQHIDEIEDLAFNKSTSEPHTSEYWQKILEEAEKRMDIIGQNGNDGLHYSKINKNQTELEL